MKFVLADMAPDWWKDFTKEQQKDYIENHPNSKLAKQMKNSDDKPTGLKVLKTTPKPVLPPKSPEDQEVFDLAKSHGVSIPPAWSKVSYHGVEGNEKGVIAEGTDSKGRKQRLENSEYREGKIKEKHTKIRESLSPKMPKITKNLKLEASKGHNEEAKVLYLITQTGFRIGGKGDGKSDKTYGASTLKGRHASVDGDTVTFNFVGKGGVEQKHVIKDHVIANMVRDKEMDENLFLTTEDKVRNEWKKHGGDKVHDIRSHVATEEAKKVIKKFGEVKDAKDFKALLKQASEAAAHKLGNKPAESLKTYIDGSVFDSINIAE